MDCDNVCPLDGHFFGGFSLLVPLDFSESSRRQNLLYWALWGLEATLKNLSMKTIDLLKSDSRSQLGASPLGSQPDMKTANSQTMWLQGLFFHDFFPLQESKLYRKTVFPVYLLMPGKMNCVLRRMLLIHRSLSLGLSLALSHPWPPGIDQQGHFLTVTVMMCASHHSMHFMDLHLVLTTSCKFIWQVQWKWSQSLSCVWLCHPMDCSLPVSSVHRDPPGKKTRVGCYS